MDALNQEHAAAAAEVTLLEGRLTEARTKVACLHARIRALTRKGFAQRWAAEDGLAVHTKASESDEDGGGSEEESEAEAGGGGGAEGAGLGLAVEATAVGKVAAVAGTAAVADASSRGGATRKGPGGGKERAEPGLAVEAKVWNILECQLHQRTPPGQWLQERDGPS